MTMDMDNATRTECALLPSLPAELLAEIAVSSPLRALRRVVRFDAQHVACVRLQRWFRCWARLDHKSRIFVGNRVLIKGKKIQYATVAANVRIEAAGGEIWKLRLLNDKFVHVSSTCIRRLEPWSDSPWASRISRLTAVASASAARRAAKHAIVAAFAAMRSGAVSREAMLAVAAATAASIAAASATSGLFTGIAGEPMRPDEAWQQEEAEGLLMTSHKMKQALLGARRDEGATCHKTGEGTSGPLHPDAGAPPPPSRAKSLLSEAAAAAAAAVTEAAAAAEAAAVAAGFAACALADADAALGPPPPRLPPPRLPPLSQLREALLALPSHSLGLPTASTFEPLHEEVMAVPISDAAARRFRSHTVVQIPTDYGTAQAAEERRKAGQLPVHSFQLHEALAISLNLKLAELALEKERLASTCDALVEAGPGSHAGVRKTNFGGFQSYAGLFDEPASLHTSGGPSPSGQSLPRGAGHTAYQLAAAAGAGSTAATTSISEPACEPASGAESSMSACSELHAIVSAAMEELGLEEQYPIVANRPCAGDLHPCYAWANVNRGAHFNLMCAGAPCTSQPSP